MAVCLNTRRVWLVGYALVLILRFSVCFRRDEEAETSQVGQVPGISPHFKKADQTLATTKGVQNFQPPDNSDFIKEKKATNKSLLLSFELVVTHSVYVLA